MKVIGLGFSILGRILQGELRRLKWQHEEAAEAPTLAEGSAEVAQDHRNEELLAEARILRQHKSRLETRMQILEDHNKQLESQLQRLRELLLQVSLGPGEESEQPPSTGGPGRGAPCSWEVAVRRLSKENWASNQEIWGEEWAAISHRLANSLVPSFHSILVCLLSSHRGA